MASINTNPELTRNLIRANKLDTFNDFYNQMLEQQKKVEALNKMSGYDPAVSNSYDAKSKRSYAGQNITLGND